MFAVEKCGDNLVHVASEFKNDKEVVLKAVHKTGRSLRHASDDLKNDDEVVLASVKDIQYNSGFQFAPVEVQDRLNNAANALGVSLQEYAQEQPNARMLQVSGAKDDGGLWSIQCTGLAGEEIAVLRFETPKHFENAGLVFRRELSESLGVSPAALRILLPGGQVLGTLSPTSTFDELMDPTPCVAPHNSKQIKLLRAIIDSESLFQKQNQEAFDEFDKNRDDAIDIFEANFLVETMCGKFGVVKPSQFQTRVLFDKADKNQDGKLQAAEFPVFFKTTLCAMLKDLEA